MVDVTRRNLLGASAGRIAAASLLSVGARAASIGNPDEPPQRAINAKNPLTMIAATTATTVVLAINLLLILQTFGIPLFAFVSGWIMRPAIPELISNRSRHW